MLLNLSAQGGSHQEPEIRHQTVHQVTREEHKLSCMADTLAPAAQKFPAYCGFGFGICGLFLELI